MIDFSLYGSPSGDYPLSSSTENCASILDSDSATAIGVNS